MSWLRDWENKLVNLEDVRRIEVGETQEKDDPLTAFGVFGYALADDDSDNPSYCFKLGTAEECNAFFERLAYKLPVVKP